MAKENRKIKNPKSNKKFYYFIWGIIAISVILLIFNSTKKTEVQKTIQTIPMIDNFTFKKQGQLSFISSANKVLMNIDIEVADTDEKRERGLMFRESMNENQGMIFLFDRSEVHSFWMKNTILSLDIIFINDKKEIVTIHKYAEPYSEKSLNSVKPVIYVVETVAGFCDKFGVKEGDKIQFQINK